jgi:hypothetical protein
MSAYQAMLGESVPQVLAKGGHALAARRGLFMGLLIVAALLAFESFNFGTTEFALQDLLGELQFIGVPWATLLALAFCAVDFAGLARLFTPPAGRQEPAEVWYLLGAWFLAATMNATLTWWGVSLALLGHQSLGTAILGGETLQTAAPLFVALLVWLLRVLIIGALAVSGERLFSYDVRGTRPRLRLQRVEQAPLRAAPAQIVKPSAVPTPVASGPRREPVPMAAVAQRGDR